MKIKLHYEEKGTGQPMVLLHGNGEDSSYFKNQIEYFSKKYRVIAVDTRGHGIPPSPDVNLKTFLNPRCAGTQHKGRQIGGGKGKNQGKKIFKADINSACHGKDDQGFSLLF